ncbi:hypothetical protein [Streptomyces zagrosensis]|uniref:Uncharacterized protein n=1 Tax=Streptomyces zagrosensis TaxID=1042984 RepID=A0A7W9QGP6_9ACTN|nr:hypothetical protein [Streptomyces zagrosensis]MBB5939664.1 hypothetical protein [Streptomyces zagrosensis]
MSPIWITRVESGAADRAAIREINLAAFPTALEADLVDPGAGSCPCDHHSLSHKPTPGRGTGSRA